MESHREQLIDGFLQDRLSAEEKAEFERLMAGDADFANEVELTRRIVMEIEKKGESEALKAISSLSSKKELERIVQAAEKSHRKKSSLARLCIVSLGVACGLLAIVYVGMQPKHSSQSLFDEHYAQAVYERVPVRGGDLLSDEQEYLKTKAIDSYKRGEYVQAVALFGQLDIDANRAELPEEAVFYAAVSMMATGDYAGATVHLRYLLDEGIYFGDRAGWYLALAYLKEGKRNESAAVLRKLMETESDYETESKELLSEISKKKLF